ncbi:MAG: hypothetical protein ACTSRZ_00775 [Promethearchaeota archaeon]
MGNTFNSLFKKRGFFETLFALYGAKNYYATLPEFFDRLEELGSYYNAFFRVKNDMIKHGLIVYGRNRRKEKTIALTEKGIKIARILKKIELLLNSSYEEYKETIKKMERRKKARERSLQRRRREEQEEKEI